MEYWSHETSFIYRDRFGCLLLYFFGEIQVIVFACPLYQEGEHLFFMPVVSLVIQHAEPPRLLTGTECIPCGNRYLSIVTFCRLRNPGRKGCWNVEISILNWWGSALNNALISWRRKSSGKLQRKIMNRMVFLGGNGHFFYWLFLYDIRLLSGDL